VFTRRGYNTYCEVPITFAQAALGAEIEIPTIDGKQTYQIREGTQPGDIVTLRGKGIPIIRRQNQRGDHIVTLNLEVPRHLSEEQKARIRAFDDSCGERNYQKQDSFFQKLKDLFN
jgi:molecular chaperone DnaJ